MNTTMRFNGNNYKVVNFVVANVTDSFVDRQLKTGSGSGESRLYVYQQKDKNLEDFFNFKDSKVNVKTPANRNYQYYPAEESCFFMKSNILEYLESVESEYLYSNNTLWEDLYHKNISDINNNYDSHIKFNIHNQSGQDKERLYIGSGSDIWYMIRKLALPTITCITILKLQNVTDKDEYIYVFLLNKTSEVENLEVKTINSYVEKANLNIIIDRITDNKTSTQSISEELNISDTEVESLVTSRVGQGKFRKSALLRMKSCPFTEISNESLLIASHIKPWSKCETVSERLDGYNGFMLTPTYDKLFDSGLISFKNNGSLLISTKLDNKTILALDLEQGKIYEINNHDNKRDSYLKYHRNNVFNN